MICHTQFPLVKFVASDEPRCVWVVKRESIKENTGELALGSNPGKGVTCVYPFLGPKKYLSIYPQFV